MKLPSMPTKLLLSRLEARGFGPGPLCWYAGRIGGAITIWLLDAATPPPAAAAADATGTMLWLLLLPAAASLPFINPNLLVAAAFFGPRLLTLLRLRACMSSSLGKGGGAGV